jgi:hypothetical protein
MQQHWRLQQEWEPSTVLYMSLQTVGRQVTAKTPLSAGTPAAADSSALIFRQETGCVSCGNLASMDWQQQRPRNQQ